MKHSYNPGDDGHLADHGTLGTHVDQTTGAHGLPNPANLVVTGDARLNDARIPTAHKATHAIGGTDVLTPGDIGADAVGAAAAAVTAHTSSSPAHAGSAISVNTSGLIVVQGSDTNAQLALARLDAAVAQKVNIAPASGATVTGTYPALEVAAGSLDQTALKPTTAIPASYVSIPTDGAAGTPTMRSQGTGVGQSSKGSDPMGHGLAVNWAYMFPFGIAQSTLTALAVYCSRFYGGSPATKVRISINTSSGNIRAAVFSSKNVGPAATPDAVKMDTGTIACPAAGDRDLSFISGGTISVDDWFLFVCDNATAKVQVSFLNSTSTLFAGQAGFFSIASMAAFPSSAPAITPFAVQPWAMGIP